jgi:transcription initiation factor TFIID subunit 9B
VPTASPLLPLMSMDDNGPRTRPRDVRLIHVILSGLGVTVYHERVPMQLMDFVYRYSSSTLQDALHLTAEGYSWGLLADKAKTGNQDAGAINIQALRLSIASGSHYQFNPTLPREHFQQLASTKNKARLPDVRKEARPRLPAERFCLTGNQYSLGHGWDDNMDCLQHDMMVQDSN